MNSSVTKKLKRKKKLFTKSILPQINMLSSAEKVSGQGVSSAYREQVLLVSDYLSHRYEVIINDPGYSEITHYHTIDFKFFLHALFGKNRTKRVAYVHFIPETLEGSIKLPYPIRKIFYWYVLRFYDTMDEIVTVNPLFIKKLEELGFDSDKITYIPNFVSEEEFHPVSREEKMKLRQQYGIGEKEFVALGVGQVQTRKGVIDFIETAKKCPDITFLWAGGFSFGTITDGYKELKEAMENAPSNCRFLGIVDRSNMNGLYNVADVMFLPSYNELFPMTVLESMNVGIPMLLRDLELYRDILFQYYEKSTHVPGFAFILNRLKNEEAYYRQCSENSYKGHLHYTRASVGSMWAGFYDSLLVGLGNEKRSESLY